MDLRPEYRRRIDAAISHITDAPDRPFRLKTLAALAGVSPFHFHRIFKAVTGQTPAEYGLRVRLERAAARLRQDSTLSITAVALEAGFATNQSFARAFRRFFGQAPSRWRGRRPCSSGHDAPVLIPKAAPAEWDRLARVCRLGPYRLVYAPVWQGYKASEIDKAWRKVVKKGTDLDLITETTQYLGVSYDDPSVTAAGHCRYRACITSPPLEVQLEAPFGLFELPRQTYVSLALSLAPDEIASAYLALYGDWLPRHGYFPADAPPFDLYSSNAVTASSRLEMQICIPVS